MSNPIYHEFLTAAHAETTAKLRVFAGPPQEIEKVIIREWPRMGRATADQLYAVLYALDSVLAPKADGKTIRDSSGVDITTRYRQTDLRVERDPHDQVDGGLIVVQTLTEGWATDALPAAQLLSDEDALLSPFALDTTSESTKQVHLYRGIDPATAETRAGGLDLLAGVISVKIEKQPDGSCRIYQLSETRTWRGNSTTLRRRVYDQYGKGTNDEIDQDIVKKQIVDVWTHIPETSIGSVASGLEEWALITHNLDTPTDGYYIDRIELRIDDAGFGEVTRVQVLADTGVPAPDDTGNEQTIGNPAAYKTAGKYVVYRWNNLPSSLVTQAYTDLQTPPSGYATDYVKHLGDRDHDALVTMEARYSAVNPNTITDGEPFGDGFYEASQSISFQKPSKIRVFVWPDISKAEMDVLTAAPDANAPSAVDATYTAFRFDKIKHLNGSWTLRVHYGLATGWSVSGGTGLRLQTVSWDRKRLETQFHEDAAEYDGYRWRVITEGIRQKWTSSSTLAGEWAAEGHSGSDVRYLGNGDWLATKITRTDPEGAWTNTAYTGA